MKRAQKKLESSYVLGKGKLTWSNPDMIACYVTPADAVVDKNILNAYLYTYKNNKVEFSGGKISLLNTESKVAHFFQKTRFRQNFNK